MQNCWGLQGCLSLAFIVEGTLFAFHLEGALLNVHAHLLLVLCIFAAAATLLLEMQFPGNVLLGVARAQLVMLQGVWFTQIARLLFEGAALDPTPGSGSTLPFLTLLLCLPSARAWLHWLDMS